MVAKQRNQDFWVPLIEEFEASGQSRAAFAKARRIKASTFQYWLYKIRRERRATTTSTFVEVDLKRQQAEGQVRIEFPGGATLVFEKMPSTNELSSVIRALCDSRC